jgi:uncharacterized membrane protein YeaQ/YmgE (transglycosylase-associated protein family)
MNHFDYLPFIPHSWERMCSAYLDMPCDSLLVNVFTGFLIGLVARLIVPGPDPAGIILTGIIGFCGSVFGMYLGPMCGWIPHSPWESIGLCVLGASIVVVVLKIIRLA